MTTNLTDLANMLNWDPDVDPSTRVYELAPFTPERFPTQKQQLNQFLSILNISPPLPGDQGLDINLPFDQPYQDLPIGLIAGSQQVLPRRVKERNGLRTFVVETRRTIYFDTGLLDRVERVLEATTRDQDGQLIDQITSEVKTLIYKDGIPVQEEVRIQVFRAARVDGQPVVAQIPAMRVLNFSSTNDLEGFNNSSAQPADNIASTSQFSVRVTNPQSVFELGEIDRDSPIDSQFIASAEIAAEVGLLALRRAGNQANGYAIGGLIPAPILAVGRVLEQPSNRGYVRGFNLSPSGLSTQLSRIN